MSKLVVLSAIAVAMLATPAIAREKAWHNKDGVRVAAAHVHYVNGRHCIRAPDVGAYATQPYKRPPCEPASWY
jgi:hypothetical protein